MTGPDESCRSATGTMRDGFPTAVSNGFENAMTIDRQKLYHERGDFFSFDGNAVMKLSREAALAVCLDATTRGVLVVKIEGGIWSNGIFEARLDAVWDGADPPVEENAAHQNNLAAANFIRSQPPGYNAFVITSASFAKSPGVTNCALAAR